MFTQFWRICLFEHNDNSPNSNNKLYYKQIYETRAKQITTCSRVEPINFLLQRGKYEIKRKTAPGRPSFCTGKLLIKGLKNDITAGLEQGKFLFVRCKPTKNSSTVTVLTKHRTLLGINGTFLNLVFYTLLIVF